MMSLARWYSCISSFCDRREKVPEEKKKTFTEEQIFSRHFTHKCPPDITSVYFSLWGYVKSRDYFNCPRSLVEMKDAIHHEFPCIQPEMLHAAVKGVMTCDFKLSLVVMAYCSMIAKCVQWLLTSRIKWKIGKTNWKIGKFSD